MSKSIHWMDNPDPNLQHQKGFSHHVNRPHMSAATIVGLLTWKSKLLGTKLDIKSEAEAFAEQNALQA